MIMIASLSSSLIVLLLSTLSLTPSNAAETVTRRYKLYHNLGSSSSTPFIERGAILLTNDATLLLPSSSSSSSSSSSTPLTAIIEPKKENEEEACKIDAKDVNDMIEKNGMYTIKVVDEESGSEAIASVRGCNVRRANFREEIALTISQTGTLLSLSYNPLVSVLAPPCSSLSPLDDNDPSTPSTFTTTVSYSTSTPGMALPLVLPSAKPPAGLSFYPRSKEKSGNGGGNGGGNPSPFQSAEEEAKNQNKSFLVKYWYIVLPLFIIGLTSGVEEPPPEEGGAGAGGAASSGGAAAAGGAAVAAAGGGQPVRRRGKRG